MRFTPSLDSAVAGSRLTNLIHPRIDSARLASTLASLQRLTRAFHNACPPPWPAPGLAITPEITYASELWLPLDIIRPAFCTFYDVSLRFSPLFASTPFATAASWATIVSGFPPFLAGVSDPDRLLAALVADAELRLKFLFWSFLPNRFYGGPERYPAQRTALQARLTQLADRPGTLRCLEAACGTGEGTYGLARLLLDAGLAPERFAIEGWTVDPLEVWAAAHVTLPHDPSRQVLFRSQSEPVFAAGADRSLVFRRADLLQMPAAHEASFDLILCNGLLGGPIINKKEDLKRIVSQLAGRLAPGGLLLTADSFHGGWKRHCPQHELRAVVEQAGLQSFAAGEGIGGLKFDQ